MKIAITGATGFVGRHLVRRCQREGWDIRVLSRDIKKAQRIFGAIEVYPGSLVDEQTDLGGFVEDREVLVHCAGEIKDETKMRELHVEGCQRLIAAAFGRVSHWLQVSSVGVYGRQKTGVVTEESDQAPVGVYEETKARADALVLEAANKGAFHYTVLRPSTVYGADMPNESLRSLIRMIQKGGFFFVGAVGAQAIYIHVEDVVASVVACIKNDRAINKIYNVSAQCSIEEFVRIVCEVTNRASVRKRIPLGLATAIAGFGGKIPGFPLTRSRVNALTTRVVFDTSKIVQELKFRPQIMLPEGLREMVLSMRSH